MHMSSIVKLSQEGRRRSYTCTRPACPLLPRCTCMTLVPISHRVTKTRELAACYTRSFPTIHPIRQRSVFVERLLCDRANNKATLDVGLQAQIDVTSNSSGSTSIKSISGEIQAAMT